MQQVSRVKSETLALVQEESDKEREKAVIAASNERDKYWEEKLGSLEDEFAKKLAQKVGEHSLCPQTSSS
jgi:hypothetical protein